METLHFSKTIRAPKEKVWDTMLQQETYRQWTESFMPGSHYIGDWNKGSKILFVAPNKKGELEGMSSRIKENRLYEFISIEHLGFVSNGVEDTTSDNIRPWVGALENYTFRSVGEATEVVVDIDVVSSQKEEFQAMWPAALEKLKALAEQS